jgi:DNA-directed RNA polymerase
VSQQEALETHALSAGRLRFLKRLQHAQQTQSLSTIGGGKSLLQAAIDPTTNYMIEQLGVKKRGVKHLSAHIIPVVTPDVAAYITARTVLNGLLTKQTLNSVGLDVADLLLDELRFRRFKAEAPGVFDTLLKKLSHTPSYRHKRKVLTSQMAKATVKTEEGTTQTGIDAGDLELSQHQRLALGIWCINAFLEATRLLDVEERRTVVKGQVKRDKFLVCPTETLQWLQQRNEAMELLWPVALPMVEPPLPWGPNNQRGGYRYALKGKYPLVRGLNKASRLRVNQQSMPTVYAALNAIQSTPWQIHTGVAEVLQEIVQRGGGVAGIPVLVEEPLPPKPQHNEELEIQRRLQKQELRKTGVMPAVSDTMREYLQTWKEWKRQASTIRDTNHDKAYTRTAMIRLLDLVETFKDHDRMYFVCNLDFRGRVYPVVSTLLSPQGDDVAKGLLTFAEGRPLGREGRRYLAQHGASSLDEWGGTKLTRLTIQERIQWIEQRTPWIVRMAEDPMAHRDWMEADSPFVFLAFCIEWAKLQQWTQQGNMSEDFVSNLPCAQDGSCNGIQHFSAMLRDPIGGRAVNLMPLDTPEDIYTSVLGKVLDILEQDAGNPDLQHSSTVDSTVRVKGGKRVKVSRTKVGRGVLALRWLTSGQVTRKLVKRPVMTYPYGSRTFGFSQQILEHLQHLESGQYASKKAWQAVRMHFTTDEAGDVSRDACQYLAHVIMQGIEQTVVAAAHAMDWLQESARVVVGHTQSGVEWVVPGTGFLVKQNYTHQKDSQVDTMLLGRLYKPVVKVDTDQPHRVKQCNAVSPNVVHSLDAAALMLTVVDAKQHGVQCFALVHDSYGAPAGDCAVLARSTRQCFVTLYTKHEVVSSLHQSFQRSLVDHPDAVLPEVPPLGTLDLSGIHASQFFFA